jgi:hypothetical protein
LIGDPVAQPGQRERVAVIDPAVAGVEQLEVHPVIVPRIMSRSSSAGLVNAARDWKSGHQAPMSPS